ncbi:hypothetical protein U2G91_15730 [Rhodococcoides fascians]|uniref:hypothetical protein n=1 Tax=Rhodococcoides fascians TaxID=1828 RepID=UPI002ACE14E1|nr:hypothetical protein [Rhodococcus fascians]WQH26553.1 hypothetical protein U2G91_15730 [Rhodococcus fascians]
MIPGEFAAIEARAAAATEGPWAVERWEDFAGKPSYYVDGALRWREHLNTLSCEGDKDTAEFIAHAREDVPALLAAVRERDNTIARIREVLDDYDGLNAEPIPKLSTHTWMHEVRAALEPQEKR